MYNKDEKRYKNPEKRKRYQREYKKIYMRQYRKNNPTILKNDIKRRKKKRKERKLLAIKLKGNRCQKCGYKKNYAALEFHHFDGKKEHWTTERNFLNWRKEKFLKELKKVLLLCSNCHKEEHHKECELVN